MPLKHPYKGEVLTEVLCHCGASLGQSCVPVRGAEEQIKQFQPAVGQRGSSGSIGHQAQKHGRFPWDCITRTVSVKALLERISSTLGCFPYLVKSGLCLIKMNNKS